jgi:hypothetical protein
MGGGDTSTSTNTQVSGSASPAVKAAADKIAGGISTAYDKGPEVFNQSTFAGAGATTRDAWTKALEAANSPDFSAGIDGAITNLSDVAAGKFLNNEDPAFQQMVDRAANGTAADINASMGANGRYGSNVHVGALADEIGALRTNAGVQNRTLELTRQQNALAALPGAFTARTMPASATGAVGAAMDQNAQGERMGEFDLSTRKANAWTDLLAKLASAGAGNAAGAGTTTTSTQTSPTTPWWMSAASLAGQFV